METMNKVLLEKIYVIIMLCRDDEIYYTDYVNKVFSDFESAKKCMYECANNEFENLGEDFEIVRLNNEIAIYDNCGMIVTRYTIIDIEKGGNDIE